MRAHVPGNSIGAARHLVTFEDPGDPVPDGEGGYTETWTPLEPATWYVRVRPATTKDAERVTAGTVITHVSHLVHGRYHPGVTTRSRMILGGEVYQVTSAVNLERRGREMELVADRSSHDQTPGPAPALSYAEQVIADGASHYWRLGSGGGTIAIDSVGFAHGTISGGVTLGQPGAIGDGTTAMTFDGATGSVALPAVVLPIIVTLESWINIGVGAGYRSVLNNRGSGSPAALLFGVANSVPTCYSDAAIPAEASAGAALSAAIWHHLVMVQTGATSTFYVDGVVVGAPPQMRSGTPLPGAANIGSEAGAANFWNGTLDEVAIYPHALTPAQIAAHYAAAAATTRRRR